MHVWWQTMSVWEDSHAVDVVGVAIVDLDTLSAHQPPPDACVIAAGEEHGATDHSEPSDTILVTWNGKKSWHNQSC